MFFILITHSQLHKLISIYFPRNIPITQLYIPSSPPQNKKKCIRFAYFTEFTISTKPAISTLAEQTTPCPKTQIPGCLRCNWSDIPHSRPIVTTTTLMNTRLSEIERQKNQRTIHHREIIIPHGIIAATCNS